MITRAYERQTPFASGTPDAWPTITASPPDEMVSCSLPPRVANDAGERLAAAGG